MGSELSTVSYYDFKGGHTSTTWDDYEDKLEGNIEVRNILDLNLAKFKLNGHVLTLSNPDPSSLIGNIYSLNDSNFNDVFKWKIDSTSLGQTYNINFRNEDNTNLPLTYTVSDDGQPQQDAYLSFSTYATDADSSVNNLPAPLGFDNLVGQSGQDVSTYVVDRYWNIEKENFNVDPIIHIALPYALKDHQGSNNIIVDSLAVQTWNGTSFNSPILMSNGEVTIDGINQNYGVAVLIDVYHPIYNSTGEDEFMIQELGYFSLVNNGALIVNTNGESLNFTFKDRYGIRDFLHFEIEDNLANSIFENAAYHEDYQQRKGVNYYSIDLTGISGLVSENTYTLKVYDNHNRIQYLHFKYSN